MSSLFSDIPDALKAKFEADAWFVTPADPGEPPDVPPIPAAPNHVITIESGIRESLFPDWNFSEAYHLSELTALAIVTLTDQATAPPLSFGEIDNRVPVKIIGVVYAGGALAERTQAAWVKAGELAENVIRVLHSCNRSQTGLVVSGRGSLVRDIAALVDVFAGETVHYGVVEIDALVRVVRADS